MNKILSIVVVYKVLIKPRIANIHLKAVGYREYAPVLTSDILWDLTKKNGRISSI